MMTEEIKAQEKKIELHKQFMITRLQEMLEQLKEMETKLTELYERDGK